MLEAEQILQGRYQLKQKLGRGISRQTWLAVDLETPANDLVIVKFLAFADVQWDELKLFEREAQVLKHLNHLRIPKYRDYFCVEERSLWFGLVQEYIPGCSLKQLLHQGEKFTEAQVRQIAADVLNILIYLHELSPAVLHRDIKPSNLIWGEDRQVYLVDFGAVQDRVAKEGVTFTVVGTYGYAPMEQFGGRAVPASDLYALGATLIHLLTGAAPADLPQSNLRIQFADRVSLSSSFSSWLQKLTEPAPEQRFGSTSLALAALNAPLVDSVTRDLSPRSSQPNNSGRGLFDRVKPPDEILGWNWGAFLIPWLWPLTNGVWIGMMVWMPCVGLVMAIALGMKGNEWAWKSRQWRSIEHFKAHQRGWAIAGLALGLPVTAMLWWAAAMVILAIF